MNSFAGRSVWSLLCVVLHAGLLSAQGTQADYERLEKLGKLTSGKVYRAEVHPHWLSDGDAFWYQVRTGPKSHEFILVDLKQATRQPAFDHLAVARQLSEQLSETVVATNLPFQQLRFSHNRDTVYAWHNERLWKISREDSTLSSAQDEKVPEARSENITTIRRSRDRGEEMELSFVNESPGEIRTIWIDRRGKQVPYKTIAKGEHVRQHTFAGHVWLVVNETDEALALFEARQDQVEIRIDGKTTLKLGQPSPRRRRQGGANSPDGHLQAIVKESQFVIADTRTDEETVLGKVDNDDAFFERGRFFWSPDGRYVIALEVQPGQERQVYTVESSPADELQPKLHQMTYAKPGDQIRRERPRLFDVNSHEEVSFDDSLFDNPWSLTDFRWRRDSSEFTFLFNQRGHQVLRLLGLDPQTGTLRTIVNETSRTFIDYTNKVFKHYLEECDELIWMSERDGWNHLYLYDWREGEVKHQITTGTWVVRGVDRIDEDQRQIWFQASGIHPHEDPYHIHHCRIDLDGSNFVLLTAGNGTHSVEYSPNHEYLIDRYSSADQPATTCARRVSDGSLVCDLEQGDAAALRVTGWQPTIPFTAKGRDGTTDVFGVIYRPTTFDPNAVDKYPVIEYIYAGPHDAFVPKQFVTHNQARAMAELGFIVVQIDGQGTNHRGKAFHDVCWKNLGDSGFPDRIAWIKAAAAEFPWMDITRVGIYGGSAGGQSALRALLAHGDFYQAAVADCGCHDNRMDKIWWNEQWMGWPIGAHYKAQSNVTNAHRLTGDLLLIVGELDRNVDPASTLQVVDALIKADKDFDLLLVPGGGHGVGSGKYGMRRTRDFFVRHLLGVEPRGN